MLLVDQFSHIYRSGPLMNVGKRIDEMETVTVKFAGDSGDGIQLTGDQFGHTTAVAGNDFATFPDLPSEIRAPQGTTYGVSSYQIQFAAKDIYTPGDKRAMFDF